MEMKDLTQTQINYLREKLELISSDEELFRGSLPELSAEDKLILVRDQIKKLLAWVESGMRVHEEAYVGKEVKHSNFGKR
jgi:hypothetical protein